MSILQKTKETRLCRLTIQLTAQNQQKLDVHDKVLVSLHSSEIHSIQTETEKQIQLAQVNGTQANKEQDREIVTIISRQIETQVKRLRNVPKKKKKPGFVMVRTRKSISNSACKSEVSCEIKDNKFTILHDSVQSLWNKHRELTVLLNSSLQGIDALCLTEHWLNEDQLTLVEINIFKLVTFIFLAFVFVQR
jgi:hypothetical protein